MDRELVIVLDFGGQYNQLIARRVRECNVYCEVHPYTLSLDKIREMNPKGIIFTGGPNSVYGEDSPSMPERDIRNGYSDSGNLLWITAYVLYAGRQRKNCACQRIW